MLYFDVTISGNGVVGSPIEHVRLPVFTIAEHEALYNAMRTVTPLESIGVELAIAFFGNFVSCLFDGGYGTFTWEGLPLSSRVTTAALLEAQGLLPSNPSFVVQVSDFNYANVTFQNGTTKSLRSLGYAGYISMVSFEPSTQTGKVGGDPNYSWGKEPKVLKDNYSIWGWDRPTSAPASLSSTQINNWIEVFAAESPVTPEAPDPYADGPGGTSSSGGGQGTLSLPTSDPISIPALPTLSAVDTGLITLFNPSLAEIKSLANYLWGPLFDLDTLKKMFANPMDAILGLSIVPLSIPSGGVRRLTIGNIDTGISLTTAAGQYVEVDCGSIQIDEVWGGYLDYAPYTKCSIYLPYVGTHPLSIDDIMGKTLQVVYHCDILSGACIALIKSGSSVLYSFIGQLASSIPITAVNYTNVINGILQIAGTVGTMVASGGFSAPLAAQKAGFAGAYTAGHFLGAGASVAQDAISMKPEVERSGSVSGTGGMLGVQVPYLIFEFPNQAIPESQNNFMGYPSFVTVQLGSISGYTEVEHIHLENIPCTDEEQQEILGFLESGVIL